jgi:CheY-like chemotaxis protein
MSRRALIVDTDRAALGSTASWLRGANLETTTASSFEEARDLLHDDEFDLLITALRLGPYNGIHLVLLARQRSPAIRAVVTHEVANGALAEEVRGEGTYGLLAKPLSRAGVLRAAGLVADPAVASPTRRWPRVALGSACAARVAEEPARLLDVSYGGVRVEVWGHRRSGTGSVIRLDVLRPAVSVLVRPVWLRPSSSLGSWWWGAEVVESDPRVSVQWRSFVDSLEPSR